VAIYHLSATVVSRGRGQSAVAAAAYRCGAVLRDTRFGVLHNYQGKRGVVHAEILAPAAAPRWAQNREELWNRVETRESRKDAQLARLIEVGLPVELSADERVALLRDFISRQFVAKGMIADFAVRGEAGNPHAHILLTLRRVDAQGFGPKERGWNGKAVLLQWRSAWAEIANQHLACAGHGVRIDHRTLEAQQIELMPGRRIGAGRIRRDQGRLPAHLVDRISEQRRIANDNGDMIVLDPAVALRALTHQKPVFSQQDLELFLRARTGSVEQFERALRAVTLSADLVAVDTIEGRLADARDRQFTSRDLLEAQESLLRRAGAMSARRGHAIPAERLGAALAARSLPVALRGAFEYLTGPGDFKVVALSRDDNATVQGAMREVWTASQFDVIDAKSIEAGRLNRHGVLVIEDCQRMRLKDLERAASVADHARALLVLWGDAVELRAMKVASPFQSLLERTPLAVSPKPAPLE